MKLAVVDKESSWRLLFDIALSHGESLRCQRLTRKGFLLFTESAALVGAATGVFPALLEELWHRHCEPWSEAAAKLGLHATGYTTGYSLSSHATDANAVSFREEARDEGVVNFDGFADMMNVISVRCFQTHRCSSLMGGDGQQTLREAITLSAEEHVRLTECVAYTATEYLKDFIHKNTVHRQTVIRLDPRLNGWTPHVKSLVSHMVGSVETSLLLPLFHRFAPTGQMNRTEYANFLRAVLPPFNAIEEASALSIFDYREFSRPSIYAKPLDDRLANMTAPAESRQSEPEATEARTIGFDAFVDAVLMLGIVIYADERMWPHHRCLTAKLWSVLEDHLCRAVPGAVMAADPLFTASHQSVLPVLSLVYPPRLPIDRLAVVLLGGLNITVADDDSLVSTESTAQQVREPQMTGKADTVVTEASLAQRTSLASSTTKTAQTTTSANPQPLAVTSPQSSSSLTVGSDTKGAGALSVAHVAATLFNATFETRTYTTFNTPVYGQLRCHTYVNEELGASEMMCPNLAALHLPRTFWNTTTFRSYVTFSLSPQNDGSGTLIFTPFRRVTVSLRDDAGVRVYTSAEVVLEAAPSLQRLSPTVITTLRSVFDAHCQGSASEYRAFGANDGDGSEENDCGLPHTISTRAFIEACRQLRLVSAATASLHCQTAVQTYWKLVEESRAGNCVSYRTTAQADAAKTDDLAASIPTSLSFSQFVCCIAHVCMKQANVTSGASLDILQYLLVALASSSSDSADGTAVAGGRQDGKGAVLPHNGMREVPYQQAMASRLRAVVEGNERRSELLETLRDVRSLEADRQQQAGSALALAVDDEVLAQELADACVRDPMLPDFPLAQTAEPTIGTANSRVPLYAAGFTREDASNAVFKRLQEDFLRQEVVIQYP